jgi:hypothetical protein
MRPVMSIVRNTPAVRRRKEDGHYLVKSDAKKKRKETEEDF